MAHTKAQVESHQVPGTTPPKWFASIKCTCGKVFSKTTASRSTSDRNVHRRFAAHKKRAEDFEERRNRVI